MTFEQFAFVWPLIAIPLVVVSTIVLTGWMNKREDRRHHPAE
jgi:hypothetical protein